MDSENRKPLQEEKYSSSFKQLCKDKFEKIERVERMLEDEAERIVEDNIEKHPWLRPVETWLTEHKKSYSPSESLSLMQRKSSVSTQHDNAATLLNPSKNSDGTLENEETTASTNEKVIDKCTTTEKKVVDDLKKCLGSKSAKPDNRIDVLETVIHRFKTFRHTRTPSVLQTTSMADTVSTTVLTSTANVNCDTFTTAADIVSNGITDTCITSPTSSSIEAHTNNQEKKRNLSFLYSENWNISTLLTDSPTPPPYPPPPPPPPPLPPSTVLPLPLSPPLSPSTEQELFKGKEENSGVVYRKHSHQHDFLDTIKEGFKEKKDELCRRSSRLADVNRRLKSQIWSSVVTIVLVEAKNLLPMDIEGLSDPYVKFRLGTEKYKSKIAMKTLNPVWLEQFDFHLYEDPYLGQELEVTVWDRDKSHQDELMGRTIIDLATLERETTHRLWRELEDGAGSIFLLLTISGTTASETISDLAAHEENPHERTQLFQRYSIFNSFQRPRDVGHLTVKVYRAQGLAAADLGGKSDPFCVLELVNARLQTQTEYKTLAPNWQKIFTFNVKDINSVLEVTVYDEDRDHKVEFLGKVAIPLLRIHNGEKRWYALKDKKLRGRAKGNSPQILLEMTVVWNVLRACIRTINPKETKYMEPEIKFKRQLFLKNVLRLKAIILIFINMGKYIQSCWEWEKKSRSILALILFVLGCYYFEPYMIPTAALLILVKYYLVALVTGAPLSHQNYTLQLQQSHHHQDHGDAASDECPPTPGDDDDDEDDKDKEEKKSLKERLQAIQEVTQTVQNSIGYIASLAERVKNLFNFTVPYLSYVAMMLAILGVAVLYLIPVRYLILAWGVNKFSRKILRPHSVPNNELLDLISRVPDDEELLNYRELKAIPTADCERGSAFSCSSSGGTVSGNPSGIGSGAHRREQRKKHKPA
ncbi:multiple C2 and transmembrane domain-containing protein isoform X5 [Cephus cinctus]|uniref:Multiple C2 and transmembrane domain-containing protein isoform X5 n=1 Tax=Cephus cinctus TaxID=211228 RepID=A0AAJ7FLM4_CEPCN|nr:multiple C2 and transmembrane domain-containing protein isoform X5 [Cephus cinctus]